jgi:hypothetical protein
MLYLILAATNEAATGVMESGAVERVANEQVAHAVSRAINLGDPVGMAFWAIAVLALIGIWFLMTRKAYPPRRYRRVRSGGPFTRMHDSIVDKVSPFVP